MLDILQSSTQSPLVFFMTDTADHISGKTGLSPTVTISKAGAAFAAPSGAVTEISSGWYKVAGNATDTNTLGPLLLHATGTGADPFDGVVANIVAYNPQDAVRQGMTALPNAAAGANGGLPLAVDASGRVDVLKVNGTNQTARDLGAQLDAAVSTRMATFTLPTNFSSLGIDVSGRVDLGKWVGVAPNALLSGRVDANVQAMATGVIASGTIASGAINDIADGLLDRTSAIETGMTPRLAMRYIAAALAGVVSGAATTTVTILGAGVGTTRITATVDANGNRSAVVLS